MKSKLYRPPGLILRTGAMTLLVMTLAWLPQANAAVTAGAVIENVATVTWEDSAANGYNADDYTQVTVNLVSTAATLSGQPTGAAPGDTALPPAGQTVLSGTTATYVYAVTAGANGLDSYNFRTPNTGTDGHGRDPTGDANVTATPTVSWIMLQTDGVTTTGAADPASVSLGGAIVTAVNSDTQLAFPGGSLSGFAINDIVVINGLDYQITGISSGTAPDHAGPTAEVQATMTLGASPVGYGYSTAPAFQTGGVGFTVAAGDIVGEQQLFRVTVTATVSPATATGTVVHDVYLDTAVATDVATIANTSTTFEPLPTVSIAKAVRNITTASAWNTTNTLTANPGDILEYRLTISNAGSTAEAVIVTDPVPTYTTLETFASGTGYPDPAIIDATPGDGGAFDATDVFAYVIDAETVPGPASIDLNADATNDEDGDLASGSATGVAATSTLTFYVGRQTVNVSAATTGGDIADSTGTPADVFEIYYRVRILP